MAEDKANKEEKANNQGPKNSGAKTARKSTSSTGTAKTTKKTTAKRTTAASKKSSATAKSSASEKKVAAPKSAAAAKKATAENITAPKESGKPIFRFEEKDGHGMVVFDMPDKPVNILSEQAMRELDAMLDGVAGKSLKTLLFVSAKQGNFIAGADIDSFGRIHSVEDGEAGSKSGQAVFGKIAALPFPTIAVIAGSCVGGGLELSLACNYRLARDTNKTKIGLPEVRLGILPGWGGTQRLPRLIGIQKALDYILTGKTVDARRAHRDGIVDRVISDDFPADYTLQAALKFADEIQIPAVQEKIKSRRDRSNLQKTLLEKNKLGRKILFDQARKKTRATTKDHYPAPLKALTAVEQGIELPIEEGLAIEAKLLGECIVSDVSKNLVTVFRLTEEMRKDKGVADFQGDIRPFKRIGVLGAGIMGGGIAQIAAYNELPVRMKDINLAGIGAGVKQAGKIFDDAVKRRKMKRHEADHKLSLISGTTDYTGFENCDLIIEAIVEDLEVKKKVFAEADKVVPPQAVIASNTSSLPITEMAKATKRPEKVAGLHFFNPVHRMPLVEVIRGEQSNDETIASLVAFSRSIGKTPIVVKDRPGFLVNRILSPYMNEATLLFHEGQTIDHIDRAITAFGMPMGPLTLFDEVGIDVTHKVAGILEAAFGHIMKASPVIATLYENQRFGKKNSRGFYLHRGKDKQVDTSVYRLFDKTREEAAPLALGIIQERCLLLMINEAARCLEEDVVRHPRDVDIGMIFGTGFPPFRGGLLRYADSLGSERLRQNLESYAEGYGERFAPAQLIVDMAKSGKKFFD